MFEKSWRRPRWQPVRWRPQVIPSTVGCGLARVLNLRVCKHLGQGVAHAGEEDRSNVLPWYRLVGVVSETQRGETGHARKGQWSPRGTEMTVLSSLGMRPGKQARLLKTVKIQVRWAAAHPGQDRRLPSVATHSRPQRATSVRSWVGTVLEDGSGVAIDWVTCRSYSSARRRLDVQSGQRKGRKELPLPARALPSVIVGTGKVLREADVPVEKS